MQTQRQKPPKGGGAGSKDCRKKRQQSVLDRYQRQKLRKGNKSGKNAVRKAAQADEAKQIATGAAKDVIKKVTEGAANNVMDEYVATPENAGMQMQ